MTSDASPWKGRRSMTDCSSCDNETILSKSERLGPAVTLKRKLIVRASRDQTPNSTPSRGPEPIQRKPSWDSPRVSTGQGVFRKLGSMPTWLRNRFSINIKGVEGGVAVV